MMVLYIMIFDIKRRIQSIFKIGLLDISIK